MPDTMGLGALRFNVHHWARIINQITLDLSECHDWPWWAQMRGSMDIYITRSAPVNKGYGGTKWGMTIIPLLL